MKTHSVLFANIFCACNREGAATCSYEFVNRLNQVNTHPKYNVTMTPFRVSESGLRSVEDSSERVLARTLMQSVEKIQGGQIVYTSPIMPVDRILNLTSLLSGKSQLVSVLFDMTDCEEIPVHWKFVMAQLSSEQITSDVFVVTKNMSPSSRKSLYISAFSKYRFSLILDSGDLHVSEPLIHAISLHTVPVYNGFFDLSTMFANGVVAWNQSQFFRMTQLVSRLNELNDQIKFLWSYQQILQEIIFYQYSISVDFRLRYVGHQVCLQPESLAFVGIYSSVPNRTLRDAIRSSWGLQLKMLGIEYKFFLSLSDEDIGDEQELYNDIIILSVNDGYRNNSKKGILFLDWISKNRSKNKFLIKTDDDIYWNPPPLIKYIANKIPVGYIWGFIDYISPVPTDGPFVNPVELYPYPTFPTYPRGVLRVVSMDIVAAISDRFHANSLRMIYGDDPTFGIHIRQLVLDKQLPVFIDDSASYSRFAMDPSCQPGWSSISNNTWIVHHVTGEQIKCMAKNSLCNCV